MDAFGIAQPGMPVMERPWGNQLLYAGAEVGLHSVWAWMGMYLFGLAPDLRSFIQKIFHRMKS
jgi:hypothetical protein